MIKNCKQCNSEFITHTKSIKRFCTWVCYCEYRKENNFLYATRTGQKSSQETLTKKSISMINTYKNNPEKRDNQRQIALSKGFGKWMKDRKLPTETRKRMSDNRKGESHWNWQGGINNINDTIRKSFEYKLWREAVFKRDDHTCQECKVRGGKLHAHHMKPFSLFPELRFAIDNGVTLCKICHQQTDTWGIKAKNYKELTQST